MHNCWKWLKPHLSSFFSLHIHCDTHPLDVNLSFILMRYHICPKGVNSKYIFGHLGFWGFRVQEEPKTLMSLSLFSWQKNGYQWFFKLLGVYHWIFILILSKLLVWCFFCFVFELQLLMSSSCCFCSWRLGCTLVIFWKQELKIWYA